MAFLYSRYLCPASSSSVRSTTSGGDTKGGCAEADVHSWGGLTVCSCSVGLHFHEDKLLITPPQGWAHLNTHTRFRDTKQGPIYMHINTNTTTHWSSSVLKTIQAVTNTSHIKRMSLKVFSYPLDAFFTVCFPALPLFPLRCQRTWC